MAWNTELHAITTPSYNNHTNSDLRATKYSIESTYSDLPCHLKVNRGKLALINCPWKCKKRNDWRSPLVHSQNQLNMTISPSLFPAVTVTMASDRKIRITLRTNQIAGFVTVPSGKKINRGYYTVVRRDEFYVRVARTISLKWAQRTSEILFLPREHKIHIFELMFFLLYKHIDDGMLMIFRRFSTTFRRFSKIVPKARQMFPNIFQEFLKISEDVQRLPTIAEDFQGRPEDVSMIHQRIY